MAAPLTPKRRTKINIGSRTILVASPTTTYIKPEKQMSLSKWINVQQYQIRKAISKTRSLPVAYKGVAVSLKPRKTPCIAKERRTAGEPSALIVKYWRAGRYIGESCTIAERLPLYGCYEIIKNA